MQTPDARRALLAGLIDHAPTFRPASLPSREVPAEDARAATRARSRGQSHSIGSCTFSEPIEELEWPGMLPA
jgi:hypothetical protein